MSRSIETAHRGVKARTAGLAAAPAEDWLLTPLKVVRLPQLG